MGYNIIGDASGVLAQEAHNLHPLFVAQCLAHFYQTRLIRGG